MKHRLICRSVPASSNQNPRKCVDWSMSITGSCHRWTVSASGIIRPYMAVEVSGRTELLPHLPWTSLTMILTVGLIALPRSDVAHRSLLAKVVGVRVPPSTVLK